MKLGGCLEAAYIMHSLVTEQHLSQGVEHIVPAFQSSSEEVDYLDSARGVPLSVITVSGSEKIAREKRTKSQKDEIPKGRTWAL